MPGRLSRQLHPHRRRSKTPPCDFFLIPLSGETDAVTIAMRFIYPAHGDLQSQGILSEKRVTDLHLEEFLSYGPQKDSSKVRGGGGKIRLPQKLAHPSPPLTVLGCPQTGRSLHRKAKDGKLFSWNVENDDPLCTLQEVFLKVDSRLGFNIELKFDDHLAYGEEELVQTLQATLRVPVRFSLYSGQRIWNRRGSHFSDHDTRRPVDQVVFEFANERPVLFSSFHPDAAQLMRRLQSKYPVRTRP